MHSNEDPAQPKKKKMTKFFFKDLFCFCSIARSYPTLCDPMDYSMPGFLVLHYLLELAQTHVH